MQFRALYDYRAEEEKELSFRSGDMITVIEKSPESGWWKVKRFVPNDVHEFLDQFSIKKFMNIIRNENSNNFRAN